MSDQPHPFYETVGDSSGPSERVTTPQTPGGSALFAPPIQSVSTVERSETVFSRERDLVQNAGGPADEHGEYFPAVDDQPDVQPQQEQGRSALVYLKPPVGQLAVNEVAGSIQGQEDQRSVVETLANKVSLSTGWRSVKQHIELINRNEEENGHVQGQGRRVSLKTWICLITTIIIGVSTVPAIFPPIFLPPNTEAPSLIRQGDTIQLEDKINPFFYDQVKVMEEVEAEESRHEVTVYKKHCKDLILHDEHTTVESCKLPVTQVPYVVSIMEDLYLLPNSNVSINATVWNTASATSEMYLCIFDNMDDYHDFSDNNNRANALACFSFEIDSEKRLLFFQKDYTFQKPSYYYAGFSVASPLTIQFERQLLAWTYNHSDYTPTYCSLDEGTCGIGLHWPSNFFTEEWCLLAYAPLPGSEEIHFIALNVKKSHRQLNLIVIVLFLFSLCMLAIITCIVIIVCKCLRSNNNQPQYVRLVPRAPVADNDNA